MTFAPDASPAPTNPVGVTFDPAAIAALHELDPDGSAGLVAQVLQAFDGLLQRLALQAEQALQRGDTRSVADAAHTLKSSAASVGATELHQCCVALERSARAGHTEPLAGLVGDFLVEARRARAALVALREAR